MGQIGLSPSDFWDSTLRTILNAIEGFFELKKVENRNNWERSRWQTWLLLNIQLEKKNRFKNPKDLTLFEWEKQAEKPKQRSKEELKRLWAKMDEHQQKQINGTS